MRKLLLSIMIIVFILVLVLSGLLFLNYKNPAAIQTSKKNIEQQITKYVTDKKQSDYANETCYTGGNIPTSLYRKPFKKTKNYVSNIELIGQLKKGEPDKYINTSKNFVTLILNTSYQSIELGQDKFIKDYCNYFGNKNAKNRAQQVIAWYIDNQITTTGEFITDKSLLYKDNYLYYQRGMIEVEVYGKEKGKEIEELFPGVKCSRQLNKVNLICEVVFVPGNSNNICEFNIIGVEE